MAASMGLMMVGNATRNDLLRDTWLIPGNMECVAFPSNPNSFGVWEKMIDPKHGTDTWNYTMPFFQILFVLIFLVWNFFHALLKRLGFPRFTSQMIAGVLLSKSVMPEGSAARSFFFRQDYKEAVVALAGGYAYILFWFLMGVKMDMSLLASSGKKATTIGLSTAILPILISSGIIIGNLHRIGGGNAQKIVEIVVVMMFQCFTVFPVAGGLLFDLKIQNSELGRLAMSASISSDFFTTGISVLGIFLKELNDERQSGTKGAKQQVIYHAVSVIASIPFVIYAFNPAMKWIVRNTPEGRPLNRSYIYAIMTLVFGASAYSIKANQFPAIGPFLLGLAIPDGPPLGSAIVEKFEPAIFGSLLPFFVAVSASDMDVWGLLASTDRQRDSAVFSVIVLTSAIKFIVTSCVAMFCRVPVRDSLMLSLVLGYRGIFELGSYALAFKRKSLSSNAFTITVIQILIQAILIPIILKRIYDPSRIYAGYMKRNMMHLKHNSEFRILTCIHSPSEISPMINLLEASCTVKQSPMAVFVLHLIKQVGKAHHLFISHQLQSRKPERVSYSENVVVSFEQLQRDHWNSVTVNCFTAVSTPKTMYNDICLLALKNSTSIIVLPFHQQWSVDGSAIISRSPMIRDLNKSVLALAPCSVGILVTRNRLGYKNVRDAGMANTLYRVCMIYIGGKDDREALTLARRMGRDARLSLTVVHLVAAADQDKLSSRAIARGRNGGGGGAGGVVAGGDWDSVLDTSVLGELIASAAREENVTLVEEVVDDVSETPVVLKSMAGEYDMFVVGRGAGRTNLLTEGLSDWSEFKELGVVGDLLTSSDLNSTASVLVVQQQQQMV